MGVACFRYSTYKLTAPCPPHGQNGTREGARKIDTSATPSAAPCAGHQRRAKSRAALGWLPPRHASPIRPDPVLWTCVRAARRRRWFVAHCLGDKRIYGGRGVHAQHGSVSTRMSHVTTVTGRLVAAMAAHLPPSAERSIPHHSELPLRPTNSRCTALPTMLAADQPSDHRMP
jgi:hypothetical protein